YGSGPLANCLCPGPRGCSARPMGHLTTSREARGPDGGLRRMYGRINRHYAAGVEDSFGRSQSGPDCALAVETKLARKFSVGRTAFTAGTSFNTRIFAAATITHRTRPPRSAR